jgi:hypothetical protein
VADTILTRRALNRATLARQLLLARVKLKPAAAIQRLAGIQAQLARPPFVGLWSRLEGFQREDLVRAVERREVVRGTLMRGTLHMVARPDYLSWRAALQPMLSRSMAAVLGHRTKGLDTDRLVAAARAYFDEEPRTFAELREHLQTMFPGLDERAMGYMVRMRLPLIQTPEAGARWAYSSTADFAVADSWLGEPVAAKDRSEAMALSYFAAFGPAGIDDFASWSGLPTARAVVDALRPKLRTFRDEQGRELFDLATAPQPDEDEEAPVRFAPEFDGLLLGYADRGRIGAHEHKAALFRKNLIVPATFFVDGFLAGLWSLERKGKAARLILKPLVALRKGDRQALAEEGERLLRFIESDAQTLNVEFGKA